MRWASNELISQLDRLEKETADDIESEILEFKGKPRGRDELKQWLVKLAVCFANKRGGCVLIGVSDRVKGREKAIVGIEGTSYRGLEREVYDATDPHILIEIEEFPVPEGVLLAAHVPKGIPPHTTSGGQAWIRVEANCEPLTGATLARMIASSGDLDLSATPIQGPTPEDLDAAALEKARERLRAKPGTARLADMNDAALLDALGLVVGGEFSQAAILLFGKPGVITRFLPQHEITILRHTSRTSYDQRADLRGPLLVELDRIEDALSAAAAVRTVRPRGFAQLEIPTISWQVAREAILNAVVHRDYFLRQGVIVALHADRLEVTSPGGFLGGISPTNILRHGPVHRNELLARSIQQLGLVERVGLGVDRIYEGLLRVGARPPTYVSDESSVSLSLPLRGNDELAAWVIEHERDSEPLSLNDLIVIRRLKDVGSIDRWSAAEHLQLNEFEAADQLADMRQRGIVIARGRGRATSYELPRPLSERLRGRGVTDADHPLEREGIRLKILELLRERGRLTNAEIRDFSGYNRQQVLAIEKALEHEGLIELHGHGRGAFISLVGGGPR